MRILKVFSLCLFALPAAAQAQDERGFIEAQVEDLLSGEGRVVDVTGFSGALSSQATMERLTIADDAGIWLTLSDVQLDWSRAALLRGRVSVEALTAGEIVLERLPMAGEAAAPDAAAPGFQLPDLPVSVNIGRVAADRLVLGAPVIGVPAELRLEGTLSLADGEGAGRIEAERLDGAEGRFVIDAAYANASRVLSVDVLVDEAQDGLVATLAGLPGTPALRLTAGGEGPIDDFDANLQLATDGVDRLTGRLSLDGGDEGSTFSADLAGDITPLFLPEYQEFFGNSVQVAVTGRRSPDGVLDLPEISVEAAQLSLQGRVVVGADGLPDLIDIDGGIASQRGTPVTLPVGGDPMTVDRADLRVGFDADRDETWTAEILVSNFSRGGVAAERLALEGTGQIVAGPTRQVTADIALTAAALDLGDPDAEEALGEEVTGTASIRWQTGAPVTLAPFAIRGESYALEGNADIATDDGAVDIGISAEMRAEDLAVFSGLAGRPLTGRVALSVSGDASPLAGLYDLAVAVDGNGLSVGIDQVDRLIAGEAAISAQLRRDETGSFVEDLSAATAGIEAAGALNLGADTGQVTLRGRLLDAGVIAEGVAGPVDFDVFANRTDGLWAVTADAAGPGLSLDADLQVVAVEPVGASGTVALRADDIAPFSVYAGRDIAGGVTVTADGSVVLDLSRIDVTAQVESRDLVTGIAEADALLAGVTRVEADVARNVDGIDLPRLVVRSAALEADGSGRFNADGSATADLTARLLEPGRIAPGLPGPVALEAAVRGGPEVWEIGADLTSPGTRGRADVSVDLSGDAPAVAGTAQLASDDLSPFSELAGRDLAGAVEARAEGDAVADLSRFDLVLTARSRDLQTGMAEIDRLLAGEVSVALDADRVGEALTLSRLAVEAPVITATASGTGTIPAGGTPVFDGEASVASPDLSPFSGLAGRALGGSVDLTARGQVAADLSSFDLVLDGEGRNLSTGIAEVDRILAGQSTVNVTASRAGEVIEIASAEVDTPQLTARADGSIGRADNEIRLDARLANLGLFVPGFAGPATVSGAAVQAGGGDWGLNFALTGPAGSQAALDGTAAPDFSTLNVGARGSAPLGFANPFIAPRSVAGVAQFNLRIDGPPALNSVSGRISTTDGRLAAPTLPFALQGIAANIDLSGGTAAIDVNAGFTTGGRLAANGRIGLSGALPADLTLRLTNAVITQPELYETRVSGEATLSGNLSRGGAIRGAFRLGETEIRIPSGSLAGTSAIPNIRHLNEPGAVRATRARAGLLDQGGGGGGGGGGGPVFTLDLQVSAPNRIFVRGRGLEAELGGALRLGGTTQNVVPSGQFDLVRGRLDILAKRFTLDEGRATLQGSFTPFIRLVANTQNDSYVISVIVDGLASAPDILFVSQPELPEDEVVSRLLFERGVENLSPFQAAQLAAAVASLAGGGGEGVVSKLRSNVGLDDLEVTGDGAGGVGVRAGKYISENIYTDVEVGSQGEASVSINLDLTDSVTAKGSVDNAGESSLGIFFEKDY